ncbi:hypothetical protein [Methylobacterium aquaticum]|uniref:hypothetical protein n=1 Tax=Methylobacterium aquaticum TaxID=270351 RepID=UPI001FED2C24|nr:hypothetical protein [Methylobacterium aquaticum]
MSNSIGTGFIRTFGAGKPRPIKLISSHGMYYALAKQFELGSTKHATLDQLEAVDLTFNVAVAPELSVQFA